jgi:hypothetical protein
MEVVGGGNEDDPHGHEQRDEADDQQRVGDEIEDRRAFDHGGFSRQL